jgi:hypothetical protein
MSQKSGIKSSEMKYTCPESPPVQSTIKDHKRKMSEEVWLIRCFPRSTDILHRSFCRRGGSYTNKWVLLRKGVNEPKGVPKHKEDP